jgi:benzoyl-CoA reductase/2-hydroxyglutaryl-CoA dehydratase subunit BcrC/BadD/HgdB
MSNAFDVLEKAYANRLAGALLCKQAGGKVAGYVSTAVPAELIESAGMYPVMITGDARDMTPLADKWMESTFDPMARSIFQAALAGELEFLDVLVIPRTADSFMRLYLYLREIERQKLCPRLPRKIVLYDLLQTSRESASRHNLAELRKLKDILIGIADRDCAPGEMMQAIDAANTNRGAVRELLLRRRVDAHVDGASALKAITTRFLMPVEEHTKLLRQWLASLPSATVPIEGPRIMVAGNTQDNAALHTLLTTQGLHVVGDYHWLGDSCATAIHCAERADPLRILADHYHEKILTSRRFPHAPYQIVAHAHECGAQGVVFYYFEAEEALTWDCPNQVGALRDAGIPSLILENQPHAPIAASLSAQLVEFTRRLRASKP